MLIVTVELLPGGRETGRRVIDRMYIWNVSQLADVSDYRFSDEDPRGRQGQLEWAGWVRGHRRSDGALELIRKVLEAYRAEE